MENEVKRKVCVITGGGSGMGLATAHRMAKKGYYTIVCGRTVSKHFVIWFAKTDEQLGYLTGADIICDGGCVASGAGAFSR